MPFSPDGSLVLLDLGIGKVFSLRTLKPVAQCSEETFTPTGQLATLVERRQRMGVGTIVEVDWCSIDSNGLPSQSPVSVYLPLPARAGKPSLRVSQYQLNYQLHFSNSGKQVVLVGYCDAADMPTRHNKRISGKKK